MGERKRDLWKWLCQRTDIPELGNFTVCREKLKRFFKMTFWNRRCCMFALAFLRANSVPFSLSLLFLSPSTTSSSSFSKESRGPRRTGGGRKEKRRGEEDFSSLPLLLPPDGEEVIAVVLLLLLCPAARGERKSGRTNKVYQKLEGGGPGEVVKEERRKGEGDTSKPLFGFVFPSPLLFPFAERSHLGLNRSEQPDSTNSRKKTRRRHTPS